MIDGLIILLWLGTFFVSVGYVRVCENLTPRNDRNGGSDR